MPYFIAVHNTAFTEEQLQGLAARRRELPAGTSWLSTYCSYADGVTYCHWDAPDAGVVLKVFRDFEIPYDTIHEVRHFDPVAAKLEAA